jgi:hypothetical protein
MIQINFKIVRNGFNVCNVTYGNYNSFEDAAEQISKEATELANASVGYFSQFNRKMADGGYRFAWDCSWESIEEIVANNGLSIGDAGKCYNKDRDNTLRWEIVVSTSTSLADVQKYLGME